MDISPQKRKYGRFHPKRKNHTSQNYISKIQIPYQKYLHTPQGTVRGETESEMPTRTLEKARIIATIPGFEFTVNIIVSSFTIKMHGQPTIICQGNKLNTQAQTALEKVRSEESPSETSTFD